MSAWELTSEIGACMTLETVIVDFRCQLDWIKRSTNSWWCIISECVWEGVYRIDWRLNQRTELESHPESLWAATEAPFSQPGPLTEERWRKGDLILSSGVGLPLFPCPWTSQLHVLPLSDSGSCTSDPLGFQVWSQTEITLRWFCSFWTWTEPCYQLPRLSGLQMPIMGHFNFQYRQEPIPLKMPSRILMSIHFSLCILLVVSGEL